MRRSCHELEFEHLRDERVYVAEVVFAVVEMLMLQPSRARVSINERVTSLEREPRPPPSDSTRAYILNFSPYPA